MKTTSSYLRAKGLAVCCLAALGAYSQAPLAMVSNTPTTALSTNANQTQQILVRYDASATVQALTNGSQISTMMQDADVKYVRQMGTGHKVYKLPANISEAEKAQFIAELSAESGVLSVEEDRWMYPMFTPNDAFYSEQWHYYESTGGANLPDAWDQTTGEGVVVAVIDTGSTLHADLNDNLIGGYDMIADSSIGRDGNGRDSDWRDSGDYCAQTGGNSSWHGTHVAGTIAAETNNGTGVAGVAFGAKILTLRALGACGGRTSDIADSIIWAAGGSVPGTPANANPAQVINMSLGGSGSCDSVTQSAINLARNRGATIVVAAGNENRNASQATPANCSGVVTVAATTRSGGRASFSNFGNVVDLAAPGQDIASTVDEGTRNPAGDSYARYSGTSMAAPHVAGVAALLYAADPSITPTEVESILKSTARNFPASCSGCGTGIVDAVAALAALDSGSTPTPPPSSGDTVLNNGSTVTVNGSANTERYYRIDVPAGASDLRIATSGGSGDVDLYVRAGARPTTSTYDCRPFREGNSEACTAASPSNASYFIMLRGFSNYSNVTLSASYSGGGVESISLRELSGAQGSWKHYAVTVPAGKSLLETDIGLGTGDADLYVRRGSRPTGSSYDCRSAQESNRESCDIQNPTAGTYYVSIYAYSAYEGLGIEVSSE